MSDKTYFVYIMTNKYRNVLYIGITSDLSARVKGHKAKTYKGFTSKYNCDILVYYKKFDEVLQAIVWEKKIKKWKRSWKNAMILQMNPLWEDLLV